MQIHSLTFHPRLFASVLGCTLLASACSGPPPKPARSVDTSADEPPPAAEWLFVTETGQKSGGAKGECDKVRTWVVGEKACTGELCTHGRDLGKEWLKRCRKTKADQADEIQDVVDKTSERAERGADDCIKEGKNLLRTNECGKPKDCVQRSQKWISTCGSNYATPLIVLMLTRLTERRFQEPTSIEFDTRSCKEMGELIQKSVGCTNEAACKQGADTVGAWNERCADGPLSVSVAFAMADVLVGASKGVDPMTVEAEGEKLDEKLFPLVNKDGKGTAVWACGERPTTLAAYVATRAKCSPGEVIFARVDPSHRVKTLSIPHPSDAEFQRLFPFLEIKGERDARDTLEQASFQKRINEAIASAKAGQAASAAAQFASALVPNIGSIQRNDEFRKILTDADPSLGPALRELARRKVAASTKIRDPLELALFASRSLQHPASDLRLDGSVLPGSLAPPSAFALSEWMPSSYALYRKELGKLEAIAKKKVADGTVAELRLRVRSEIAACSTAQAAITKAEEASASCLFRETDCTPVRAAGLSSAADQERERLATAHRSIALILTSTVLDRSDLERIEAEKVTAGCLD